MNILSKKWNKWDTLIAIISGVVLSVAVILAYLFFNHLISNQQATEKTIELKMVEKGIYFGPFYKAITNDHSKHRITQNEFYDTQMEKISGFKTDDEPFFTTLDFMFYIIYFIIILIILLIIVLFCITYFYRRFYHRSIFSWRKFFNKYFKPQVKYFIIMYLLISLVFLVVAFKNMYPNLLPFGHTYTRAKIIDQEITKRYGRFSVNDYYFVLTYTDDEDNHYLSKTQVGPSTFRDYERKYSVPIYYETNHPANHAIHYQSLEKLVLLLPVTDSIILLGIIYSYIKIYHRWKSKRKTYS